MAGAYYIGDDGEEFDIGADLSPEETEVLIKAISSGEPEDEDLGAGVGQMYQIGDYEIGAGGWGRWGYRGAPSKPIAGSLSRGMVPVSRGMMFGRGQPPPRMPLRTMPKPAPMGVPPMRIRETNPNQARVLYLGFDSGSDVAAGSTVNVNTNTQDVFKPRKIIIPATIAPLFVINDIKVGNISQFSSSSAVPAEAFVAGSVAADVNFDTAQVSQQITFNVSNVSGAAARFRAAICGYVARL